MFNSLVRFFPAVMKSFVESISKKKHAIELINPIKTLNVYPLLYGRWTFPKDIHREMNDSFFERIAKIKSSTQNVCIIRYLILFEYYALCAIWAYDNIL